MSSRTLVLLRHGESTWNLENRFTGWTDVGLTGRGEAEGATAGTLIAAAGIEPTVVHTSVLSRAISTMNLTMTAMDRLWIPVLRDWRLNERHYGALQGLNKAETAARHGEAQVHLWRRSYDIAPPPLDGDDPRHPKYDPRYARLDPALLPSTESLADVVRRLLPYWEERIAGDLDRGEVVLIVAHGNSLRALVKHLDWVSDEAIPGLNIPTGIPLVYTLDHGLRVLQSGYLGDPKAAAAAAEAMTRPGREG